MNPHPSPRPTTTPIPLFKNITLLFLCNYLFSKIVPPKILVTANYYWMIAFYGSGTGLRALLTWVIRFNHMSWGGRLESLRKGPKFTASNMCSPHHLRYKNSCGSGAQIWNKCTDLFGENRECWIQNFSFQYHDDASINCLSASLKFYIVNTTTLYRILHCWCCLML